jgi:hypothetical protein
LVKHGIGPERIATVGNEASVYGILSSTAAREVRAYLPRIYGYDDAEHILILELLQDALNLREYHAMHRRIPVGIAGEMGAALATLHRSMELGRNPTADLQTLDRTAPWILFINQPDLRILQQISGANLELIKTIQGSAELCESLNQLRRGWKRETLIHFDVKLDNWLITNGAKPGRKPRLRLIDWELAGLGDPCWDVGSAFMDYLSLWLLSIPITVETPLERLPELAMLPLDRMHSPIRALWRSYVRGMHLDSASADEWLVRSIRYAAARLVQTAFEQAQTSAQLSGNVRCMLQVSANILRWPREAIVHLLGIPLTNLRLM